MFSVDHSGLLFMRLFVLPRLIFVYLLFICISPSLCAIIPIIDENGRTNQLIINKSADCKFRILPD